MLVVEDRNGNKILSTCSPISFEYVSFWCPFLDGHLVKLALITMILMGVLSS